MIYGIGVDLLSIDRLRKMNPHFFEKYYTTDEIEYCRGKINSFAGLFAAKEAFVKALGTGFLSSELKAVEIRHNEAGAPFYSLHGWAAAEYEKRELKKAHLTISHDGGLAEAFCILEY